MNNVKLNNLSSINKIIKRQHDRKRVLYQHLHYLCNDNYVIIYADRLYKVVVY